MILQSLQSGGSLYKISVIRQEFLLIYLGYVDSRTGFENQRIRFLLRKYGVYIDNPKWYCFFSIVLENLLEENRFFNKKTDLKADLQDGQKAHAKMLNIANY